jgi:hypothetical protein
MPEPRSLYALDLEHLDTANTFTHGGGEYAVTVSDTVQPRWELWRLFRDTNRLHPLAIIRPREGGWEAVPTDLSTRRNLGGRCITAHTWREVVIDATRL